MSVTPYWFEALDTVALRRLVARSKAHLAYAKAMGWDTTAHREDYHRTRRALRKRERAEKGKKQ